MNDNPHQTAVGRNDTSRVLPLLIAGGVCFLVAVGLGYGSWKLFGSGARDSGSSTQQNISSNTERGERASTNPVNTSPPAPEIVKPEVTIEIQDAVKITGGETVVGGGVSQRPVQRIAVQDFFIAETEVTNEEYAAFVKETGHRAPEGWKKNSFPKDKELHPVVNVSVGDANAFCEWKSTKINHPVRLPTYPEWQRAASGDKRFKYPWGNEWNEEAIPQKRKKSTYPVKSFELNKSPFGAYDMLGNVWEWTAEPLKKSEIVTKAARKEVGDSTNLHLVLGGSYREDRDNLANSFWTEIADDTVDATIGFRYVIVLDNPQVDNQ